ncbi:F0F1 ATP synthase subunit delta [Priestia taiwanensis]|uniref:ATP synthase subunit delta n=1 Tax=Priestia taiwanensis TaxID=1347902 RepID=A0A917ES92_9BACI|nr:F0F1 ATP synthase subunit delta [Priestia taiwanensis]MBM7365000.1 F-type H+-transporting ATPase subunit delta [Priestia taiwanensis]GGE81878.1 ATP synthase subunit delta [Priestia taiwanensis]
MNKDVVAKRYGSALFQLAKEQDVVDTIEQSLRVVKGQFVGNHDLQKFLQIPTITKETKKQFIRETFASISDAVLNLLFLLIDRHRDDIVPALVDDYIERANEYRNIAEATVYSVRPLTEEETKALAELFAKKVNKETLRVTNIVDSTLLGGIKVRIGNRIYDGSLSSKLMNIQRELEINSL